jgi:hypothetical protein
MLLPIQKMVATHGQASEKQGLLNEGELAFAASGTVFGGADKSCY